MSRTYPTVDESLDRLRRAGWSVGDTATASLLIVSGTNRENQLYAASPHPGEGVVAGARTGNRRGLRTSEREGAPGRRKLAPKEVAGQPDLLLFTFRRVSVSGRGVSVRLFT